MSTPARLHISPDISLPVEIVTETIAILGRRGSGKSFGASVIAEEMLKAGLHIVVIDPLDAWFGLRSSADGLGEGLPIAILGGEHGDVALDAGAGQAIADVVVDDRLSAVLSLRHLSKSAQRRFVADFCERLYDRKGSAAHRLPLHVFIDESDAFVPQRVMGDTARVMGAVDDLVRRGRSSGLGVTLITQRPAVIHKDVLTQLEILVAFRVVSPQDRKALEAWIDAHDSRDQRGEFMASLASLPVGTAWFWSPGALDLFQRVQVRRRETFDSSSTPAVGAAVDIPRIVASVDMDRLRERIGAPAPANTDDVAALRRQIAALERQLADTTPQVERVEVPVLTDEQEARIRELADLISAAGHEMREVGGDLRAVLLAARRVSEPHIPATAPQVPRAAPEPPAVVTQNGHVPKLKAGALRMLQALATLHPQPLTRTQLGTLSGIAPRGGTFASYLGDLRRAGLIALDGESIAITSSGIRHLGHDVPARPLTTSDLVGLWSGALKAGARRMLDVLVAAYPQRMSRAELGRAAVVSDTGGTFSSYLSTLRGNGLVEVEGSEIRASESLFIGSVRSSHA